MSCSSGLSNCIANENDPNAERVDVSSSRIRKKRSNAKLVQSTLVISTSVISNNRLSRRENLVPVLTQKSKIRLQNIVKKKKEKLLLGSNFSPFPQYFQYIFLTKGVKLHSHL